MSEKLRCMTSIFLKRNNQILMLYRQGGRVVNNVWVGAAGGHFEENELNNPEVCILRELKEELGILENEICNLTLKYIALRRTNGEIRQNYYYFADLKEDMNREFVSNEGELQWFDYDKLLSLEMPITVKGVLDHYLRVGRLDDKIYGGFAKLGEMNFAEFEES